MRVPPGQLLVDGIERVVDAEQVLLRGHLSIENSLQEEVAEFFGQAGPIAPVDSVQHFVRLFEREGFDAVEGLLAVPRAAARRAQTCHDSDQLFKLLASGFHCGGAVSPNLAYAR